MGDASINDASILVVDDEPSLLLLAERLLRRAGYANVTGTSDPYEAVAIVADRCPDLLLLDLHMPRLDGYAVLEAVRARTAPDDHLPVLVLTADATAEARRRALAGGATDFLIKPFDSVEVALRVGNALQVRLLHQQLRRHNEHLEQRVHERTRELDEARIETLDRLALAAEYRDDTTGQHTRRVARLSALLARELACAPDWVAAFERAAALHDVGKIGISDAILLKPARLDPAERAAMERHTLIGASILSGSRFETLQIAEAVALSHHERWDGGGYPHRLAGDAIPLPGRIVAVADVFDALVHPRPYKPAWPFEAALAEVVAQSGRQFDPDVAAAIAGLEVEVRRVIDGRC